MDNSNKTQSQHTARKGFLRRSAGAATRWAFGDLKKVVGAPAAIEGAVYVRSTGRAVWEALNPFKKPRQARHESFSEACKRLRVTEASLAENYRVFALQCAIGLSCVAVGLGVAAGQAWSGSVMGTLAAVGFIAMGLGVAFKGSFRAAQIAHRELFGVDRWLSGGASMWIPRARLPAKPRSQRQAKNAVVRRPPEPFEVPLPPRQPDRQDR